MRVAVAVAPAVVVAAYNKLMGRVAAITIVYNGITHSGIHCSVVFIISVISYHFVLSDLLLVTCSATEYPKYDPAVPRFTIGSRASRLKPATVLHNDANPTMVNTIVTAAAVAAAAASGTCADLRIVRGCDAGMPTKFEVFGGVDDDDDDVKVIGVVVFLGTHAYFIDISLLCVCLCLRYVREPISVCCCRFLGGVRNCVWNYEL